MKPELIVQIPPLQPDGRRELQAQARQGDMQAAIIIRPYGSNTYILELYWDRTNTKIRRKLTSGQDERGFALARLLRERLTKALEAAGWQDAGQNYEGRPLWRYVGPATSEQHPLPPAAETSAEPSKNRTPVALPRRRSRKANNVAPIPLARPIEIAVPVLVLSQPDQAQQPARKRIEVPVATKPRAAYQRTIHTRSVTFTCEQCGATSTQQRFPGPPPRYCTEVCKQEAQRTGTLARVQRFRARQREKSEGQQ